MGSLACGHSFRNRLVQRSSLYARITQTTQPGTSQDEEFFKMLQQVPGVTHVEWNTSKTSQGNPSKNHHMERNILVTSSLGPGSASHPLEFELTWNQHMKDKRLPFTVTACFKEPSPDLVPEAWRILAEVVKGRELFPAHVARYRAKVLGLAS